MHSSNFVEQLPVYVVPMAGTQQAGSPNGSGTPLTQVRCHYANLFQASAESAISLQFHFCFLCMLLNASGHNKPMSIRRCTCCRVHWGRTRGSPTLRTTMPVGQRASAARSPGNESVGAQLHDGAVKWHRYGDARREQLAAMGGWQQWRHVKAIGRHSGGSEH